MPGDYSRFTDDPRKRFSRVLFQQGRVIQDADLDEMVEILTRRDRLHALDIMGRFAIPRFTTPNGFDITPAGPGDLNIGAGRAYVDGIVAEALLSDSLRYTTQPFYPDPPPLSGVAGGAGLIYLDVWDREITALEDTSLLDPALGGVDTATRTKTVWQVKAEASADCSTDLDARFRSAGLLSTHLNIPADPTDPCLLPESGGLRDVENRFYRVEIHSDDGATIKFKFARDPIATRITNIPAAAGKTTLDVERTGLDSVLRFSDGDWVEVTSDYAVLRGESGFMARIERVFEDAKQIRLDRHVPATPWADHPQYPPRLIRWDQRATGGVTLDGDGLITATGSLQTLEGDLQVRITRDGTGRLRRGDTWYFATRVANNTVDTLNNAPPFSAVHHYMPLAVVSGLAATPVITRSCRVLWPPETAAGDDCECTVCVSPPADGVDAAPIINRAIVLAKSRGGGKVCLKPGPYWLGSPILIQDAACLSLTGHGLAVLLFRGVGPVILVERSADVTVEELIIIRGSRDENGAGMGVEISNCLLDVTVQDCVIVIIDPPDRTANRAGTRLAPASRIGVGIALSGVVLTPRCFRNVIAAAIGIGNNSLRRETTALVFTYGLEAAENLLLCGDAGIAVRGVGLGMDVRQNWIVAGEIGVWVDGLAAPGGAIVIDGNTIYTAGAGVRFSTGQTTVSNNSITGLVPPDPSSEEEPRARLRASGIIVGGLRLPFPAEHLKILANRIAFFRGNGIVFGGAIGSAMVKQNTIAIIGGGAIVGTKGTRIGRLSISNNDVGVIGVSPSEEFADSLPSAGVFFAGGEHYEITDNNLFFIAPLRPFPSRGVFLAAPKHALISRNSITDIQASPQIASAGIEIEGAYGTVEIADNRVTRKVSREDPARFFRWHAVKIGRRDTQAVGIATLAAKDSRTSMRTQFIIFLSSHMFRLYAAEQALLIRGNVLHSIGATTMPIVDVITTGTTTFGENDCRAVQHDDGDARPGIAVVLRGETAAVTANHVFGGTEVALAIATSPEAQWTILGNIVQKIRLGIRADGNPLTPPWADLNRELA